MPLLKWFRRQNDRNGQSKTVRGHLSPPPQDSSSPVPRARRQTDQLANLFNLLRSPVSILYALLQGEQSFGRLEQETSTRSYSTTINLRALMAAGLIEKVPGKRTAPYRITQRGIQVIRIVNNLVPLAEEIEPVRLEPSNGRGRKNRR